MTVIKTVRSPVTPTIANTPLNFTGSAGATGSNSHAGTSNQHRAANRGVAYWLLICAAMVFLIVVIGGITRLTESGLSITEWRPVSGVLPPLSEEAWQEELQKYRQTTEYQEVNRGMSLHEFKVIFFWEYLHRLWGRLVGLVFALPFLIMLFTGRIPRQLVVRLTVVLLLIGAQGFLGWYMVQSGLSGRTDVSQYRLAAHLSLALVIYAMMLWTAVSLLLHGALRQKTAGVARKNAAESFGTLVFALVSLTIVSGAFVAGMNAGKVHNTFPLMGGRVIPAEYSELTPWLVNVFENPAAVQFNHRMLAVLAFIAVVALWFRARRAISQPLHPLARAAINWSLVLALVQVLLGISTLLTGVSIHLAATHQAGAVLLLTSTMLALLGLRASGSPSD